MAQPPSWLAAARAHWQWRGQARPPFAAEPGPGQHSVWDFPRPPALAPDTREVVVRWGDVEVVRTTRAIRVLETAHPPTFYLPWADADRSLFQPAAGSSFCEWKGPARYWSLVRPGGVAGAGADVGAAAGGGVSGGAGAGAAAHRLDRIAWSYPQPLAGAEALADFFALYAWPGLHITVGGETARPQPGGFYGGWVTPDLAGPFKGDPGSEGW